MSAIASTDVVFHSAGCICTTMSKMGVNMTYTKGNWLRRFVRVSILVSGIKITVT